MTRPGRRHPLAASLLRYCSKSVPSCSSAPPRVQVLIDDCDDVDFENIVTFAPLRRKLKRCLDGLRQKADYVGADSQSLSTMELHQGLRQLNDTMHVLASALARPPGETYAPSYSYPTQPYAPYASYAEYPPYPLPTAAHQHPTSHPQYQSDAKARSQFVGEVGPAVKTATRGTPPQQRTPSTTPDPHPLSAESVRASPEPIKLAAPTGAGNKLAAPTGAGKATQNPAPSNASCTYLSSVLYAPRA